MTAYLSPASSSSAGPARAALLTPGARTAQWAAALGLCALLAACATRAPAPVPSRPSGTQPAPAPVATPAPAPAASTPAPAPVPAPLVPPPTSSAPSPGAAALREGVRAFDLGEYGRAEQRLALSLRQGLNSAPEQVQAFKTQAFVWCITRRTAACERAFEQALAADRAFNLSPGEQSHPIWGPAFTRAQSRVVSP